MNHSNNKSIDLKDAYWSIQLPEMAEKTESPPSSDEEHYNQGRFPTTDEERRGTIPPSPLATAIAVSLSTPHANPVVGRGIPKKKKKAKKKIYKKCLLSDSQSPKKDKPDKDDNDKPNSTEMKQLPKMTMSK